MTETWPEKKEKKKKKISSKKVVRCILADRMRLNVCIATYFDLKCVVYVRARV